MLEIPNAQPIASILTERELIHQEWAQIGNTIRRFHRLGFQHVDLNANNILLDYNGKVHLVDFDRCQRRKFAKSWANSGLKRLQRSLLKLQRESEEFYFLPEHFDFVVEAHSD